MIYFGIEISAGWDLIAATTFIIFSVLTMADFLQGASNTDASHARFTSIGQNQYIIRNLSHNTSITYPLGVKESALTALKPVDRSGWYIPPCTARTREWIVEKIHCWLMDEQAPNIFWLSGSPGAGKSTVASTMVSHLAGMGILGSAFFCRRSDIALSDPTTFWRTVAFDLAQRNAVIADRVVENLKAGRADPTRADIESHFKYLIEDPLAEFWKGCTNEKSQDDMGNESSGEGMQFPVVVLDALDECGSGNSPQRRIFMDTLTKWSRLNPRFKLFVTSRDHGITPAFRAACHHIALETGGLVAAESNRDIQNFLEQRFSEITSTYPSLPPSWPGESVIKRIVDRAAGLFIWADTVVRFLEQGFPKEQLDLILGGTFRDEEGGIDELYRQILHLTFKNSKNRILDVFKGVVGAIALAKTPLHRTDLKHFLEKQEDESAIDFILGKLSSVVTICNPGGRIYISHLSFAEFICDPGRCDRIFVIDSPQSKARSWHYLVFES